MLRTLITDERGGTTADDQQLQGRPEVGAHLGLSLCAARNRKSRGSLPAPDDTIVPDRPRWRPATFQGWGPVGRVFRSDLRSPAPHGITPSGCPALLARP
ncbi:MarR family transcriptional regulator [Streptomyces luridiscabiei]|uniref:MarR family transcriptional regulator n=1 Tax=Streptomyces luridiscabiei TaxID=164114 RepID=UPI001F2A3910|nr:MarR family transcriptional regulator [Streptomyces luridiscabiei]